MHRLLPKTVSVRAVFTRTLGGQSRLWRCVIPIALVLGLSAVLPALHAVSPPPDGDYPQENTAEGKDALLNLTTGVGNTALGFNALLNNTTGTRNTATGSFALFLNTSGGGNTANGDSALYGNKTGDLNTAVGQEALFGNTSGDRNTAIGWDALLSNTSGNENTGVGYGALGNPTPNAALTGNDNTAIGVLALASNSTGSFNAAIGAAALFTNTTGIWNTANGWGALNHNSTGSYNAADGLQALFSNTTGNYNTAGGLNALFSNTSGNNNIGLGSGAGGALTTGSNNIDIGNSGVAGESAKIRVGTKGTHKNTYVAGIYGVTASRGVGVFIDSTGHLGTTTSSARFKDQIKPMEKASEAILALKPVTFRYKPELDPDGVPQFGLIAEQVEKVNPDLVVRDEDGKVNTVRYEAVNAMLLNEFLKEHRKVEKLECTVAMREKDFKATVAQQQKQIAAQQATAAQQQKQIEALTATVRKVSDQISLSKPSPQLVANP